MLYANIGRHEWIDRSQTDEMYTVDMNILRVRGDNAECNRKADDVV